MTKEMVTADNKEQTKAKTHSENSFLEKANDFFCGNGFMTAKDYINMAILTFLFLILAFFRLGNRYAPVTEFHVDGSTRDIVLDFGNYVDIGQIHMFLGSYDNRNFSLSAFNEVTGEWQIINGDAKAGSVFTWNDIDVYYNLRYLGIVPRDEKCSIHEIVVTAPDGTVLSPSYSAECSSLFDEQIMFPKNTTYMDGTYFDEVYYARTGYEFIHGLKTYETTHPQLGKNIIAFFIRILGMNPYGWRFGSALFGVLMVPLMYLFTKRLFKNTFVATATTALLSFDFMHFSLSRICTIDMYVAFFILFAYYFLYKYFQEDMAYRATPASLTDSFPPKSVILSLGLSGLGMSLAIATKLTGVYAAVGMAVLLLWYTITHKPGKQTLKLGLFCFGVFIILPLILYVLAYIPVVGDPGYYSGVIDKAYKNTTYMIGYHSNLQAEHYYASPFYKWPIIWMPLLYALDDIGVTDASAISCMGNPIIWWIGIPCVFFTIYRWIIKKDKKAGFLVISYLAQYVFWFSVGRITFIYHYFPAILFTMLMMGYTMNWLLDTFDNKKVETILKIYVGICIAFFIVYYPVISGLPFLKEWGLHLRLLKDWILVF